MSPIDVLAGIAVVILVILLLIISYLAGSRRGIVVATTQDIRRPVNTYLYYKAPPPIRNELSQGLRVTAVREISLPENFDARQKWPDSIGEPLDQGTCGSCWAFASAMALTDRFRIAEPDNTELRLRFSYCPFIDPPSSYVVKNALSPYELVSCDICELTQSVPITSSYVAGADQECDMGCEGGFITHVYDYIAQHGITTMVCTPPTCDPNDPPGTDCDCVRGAECRVYKPRNVYGLFDESDNKATRVQKIKEDLYAYGTVTTGFTVYNSFYQFFQEHPTGVYTQNDQPPGDLPIGGHAINVIGWGVDSSTGTNYWLCQNSWGIKWGDQGYFKIQYDWGDILEPIWMAARI